MTNNETRAAPSACWSGRACPPHRSAPRYRFRTSPARLTAARFPGGAPHPDHAGGIEAQAPSHAAWAMRAARVDGHGRDCIRTAKPVNGTFFPS